MHPIKKSSKDSKPVLLSVRSLTRKWSWSLTRRSIREPAHSKTTLLSARSLACKWSRAHTRRSIREVRVFPTGRQTLQKGSTDNLQTSKLSGHTAGAYLLATASLFLSQPSSLPGTPSLLQGHRIPKLSLFGGWGSVSKMVSATGQEFLCFTESAHSKPVLLSVRFVTNKGTRSCTRMFIGEHLKEKMGRQQCKNSSNNLKNVTPETREHKTGRLEHPNPEKVERNKYYESDRVP